MRMRKGSFLVDTLLGMMILIMAILPLAASTSFAYSVLTSSVEKSTNLSKIYSETEKIVVKFSTSNDDFCAGFTPVTGLVGALRNGWPDPDIPFDLTLLRKEETFGAVGRGTSSVWVYIIK